jgi:hypothetical protein
LSSENLVIPFRDALETFRSRGGEQLMALPRRTAGMIMIIVITVGEYAL